MEKDKEIKAVQLKEYFTYFTPKDFQLIKIGIVLIVLSAMWLWLSLANPEWFAPPIYTNVVPQSQSIVIATEKSIYRDIPVFADVYRQIVNFYAGVVPLPQYPTWLYIAALIAAFSFILSASRYSTLPVFVVIATLFVFFGVATRTGSLLNFEGKNLYHNLALLLYIFANVGIAYAHQKEWLNWSNFKQFIFHFSNSILFFGILYGLKGKDVLFCTSSYVFPIAVIGFFLFIILSCRVLLHTVLYYAFKSNIPEKRWNFGKITIASSIVWLIPLSGMLILNYVFESKRIYAHWITSILLVYYALSAGVWMQTEFKKLTFITNTRVGFFVLIIGLGLLSVSSYTYMIATFEDRMLLVFGNFLLISSVIGMVMFYAYVFYNYYPVIKRKYAIFYVLDDPKRLPYFFIYIFMAIFITTTHLSYRQKTFKVIAGSYATQIADYHYRHAGYRVPQLKNAAKQYDAVYFIDAYNFKAAYQSAVIYAELINKSEYPDIDSLRKVYQWAIEFSKYNDGYPYAYLNMGNIYAVSGRYFYAAALFQEGVKWSKTHKAELATNLATAYQLAKLKDSATYYFRFAHQQKPSDPNLAANLGLQYYQMGLKKEAKSVFETAAKRKVNTNLMANLLYYNLLEKDTIALPKYTLEDTLITHEHVPYLRNYASYAWQFKKASLIQRAWQHQKYDSDISRDIKYIRCVEEFLKGEYSLAHLFAQEIASAPEYASMNDLHTVGIITYFLNNYSTAGLIFEKAAQKGLEYDKYLSAAVQADASNYLLSAQKLVTLLSDTTFTLDKQIVQNELYLLSDEKDLSKIPQEYYFRIAVQAGYQDNAALLNTLLDKIVFNTPLQYLELAKMFIFREEYTRAEKTLQNGLAQFANEPSLMSLLISLYINQQQKVAAKQAILALTEKHPSTFEGMLNQARLLMLNGQRLEAMAKYKELLAAYDYKEEVINELSVLYIQSGENIEAYNFHFKYVQSNPYNRQMWYQYAYMAKLLERENDVIYAAQKVIELAPSQLYQERIAKHFGLKLQQRKTQNDK
ncbi:MAG: hypothetical protein RML38_01405 [Bacteroidia bacterium]|nr:hypothetical protein [Bacteroidia bacterium]